jgi:protein-L-isoaspartate O-methyltransferase
MNQRSSLVADLVAKGSITSDWVRDAFEGVPREVFVPRFYRRDGDGSVMIDGGEPRQRREWLDGVYADTALVVQATAAADVAGRTGSPPARVRCPP